MADPGRELVTSYLPERPITSEIQDRFGRAEFARRLAKALLAHDGKLARGVVVGLVGPWGSGKSSTLNLLQEYLSKYKSNPVVVRFEPWIISKGEDLLISLTKEIYGALKKIPPLPKNQLSSLKRQVLT